MNIAIIAASGKGERMGTKVPKLFLPVHGKPFLYYTISALYDHPEIDQMVITTNRENTKQIMDLVENFFPGHDKKITFVKGGDSRAVTVKNAFDFVSKNLKTKPDDLVIIHNGANPLVESKEISKCIAGAKKTGACITASAIKGTVKEINKSKILKTHKRENFVEAQTPQVFKAEVLKEAYKKAGEDLNDYTDEALLAEQAGFEVQHIKASEHNFKVTTKKDYEHVKQILGDIPEDFVFGIGQDSHRFAATKGLYLGGYFLEDEYKLEANSDGDVLLHALCNAVSQAIGQKSIGSFADDLCINNNIKDSKKYLHSVLASAKRKGFKVNNIGCMIECKKPNIDKISLNIKESLSELTGLNALRIGITATSGENLTSFGKGKGIQCFCIVSLKKT